jgi:co-chaperonin GroES (HSP10)
LISPQAVALAQAFPVVDPGVEPCGSRILVQLRTPKTKVGSIMLIEDTQETEKWNTQVAKVLKVGPIAFKHRDTQEDWKEGAWAKEGDFIRLNRYVGDRFEMDLPDGSKALFVLMNDLEVTGRITGDPLAVKAFI